MFIEASRHIRNTDTVFVGSGISFVVAMLAQRLNAPHAGLLIDSGAIDPIFESIPLSVSDSWAARRAVRLGSMREVLASLIRRGPVVAILGAAQVDAYANINSSYVNTGASHLRRLPGSGGATAVTWSAQRLLLVLRHERHRLPERCDYISSPGYLDGAGRRAQLGIAVEQPEISVITDLCVMSADKSRGRLVTTKLMPGVDARMVQDNTPYAIEFAEDLTCVAPPSSQELAILRQDVDPKHLYVKQVAAASP